MVLRDQQPLDALAGVGSSVSPAWPISPLAAQDLLLGIESTEDYALSTYEELLQLHREHIIASQRLSCSLSSCDVTQLALLDSA